MPHLRLLWKMDLHMWEVLHGPQVPLHNLVLVYTCSISRPLN